MKKISIKHLLFSLAVLIVGISFASQNDFFSANLIISPLVDEKPVSTLEKITPLLKNYKNTFKVQKRTSFIEQAFGADEYEKASAYGAIDYDTGNVIIDKNLEKQIPIASITKVMTAIVALDLAESGEYFIVSKEASKIIPTKIGVVPGEKMSLHELLNAILLTSANDAAEVIKEGIDEKYNDKIFIEAMNKKAEFIGLSDTSFQNPQGFDSNTQYSSVHDLAILTHYALTNYPEIAEIVKKDYEFLPEDENHKQFDLFNWNGLIGVYPNTYGVKIGSTGKAGKTTVVISERANKKVIAIVLGAPGVLERDLWASQILDAAFEDIAGLAPMNITQTQLKEKYNTWNFWN